MDGRPRILGVDDSLTIRKALEIVLKPAGYDLELAVDGNDALAKAKSFKPALILLDFILPDMRGSEVCQQLALDAETANIPVILVSAKGAEIRQAYRDARNVVSYIAKPFKPQVVTSIVGEVLAKAAAGELIKSTVPVHEVEGMAAAPSTDAPPPASMPAPTFSSFAQPEHAAPFVSAAASPQIPPPDATQVDIAPAPTATAETAVAAPAGATSAHSEATPSPILQTAAADTAVAPTNGHAREETDEGDLEEGVETTAVPSGLGLQARREALEVMFETLRSGIEGVYVEEVDTPLGAAADQAKSYTDLLDSMTHELAEGLRHAHSGARYSMYGDGSVRSLDESLLEIFRRSCRLLFRAVRAGAVANEAPPSRRRILVACHKDSPVHRQVEAMLAAHPDWQVFTIAEGFRQLPIMMRLFGPTDIIAEVAWRGPLWDQLHNLQRLPEAREINVIGVTVADRLPPPILTEAVARELALRERGVGKLVDSIFQIDATFNTESAHSSDPLTPSAVEGYVMQAAQ
ncbi:MAG: response regulator [Deltaproteobacteria bacterium]|nr:response regulator [Deltaproteobacteria bacterium]